MTVQTILDAYKNKYMLDSRYSDKIISEIAMNCFSLSETWKENSNISGSITLSIYDNEDLLIDSLHGNSWETLPVELMNVCINRSNKVKNVRVWGYLNGESKLLGHLNIS